MGIMIEQRHIDAVRKYLGGENLRYFSHLKGLKGEVFPVLKLNYRKKGIPVHPVGLREGVKERTRGAASRGYVRPVPVKTWNYQGTINEHLCRS